jgi:hypothetical protein
MTSNLPHLKILRWDIIQNGPPSPWSYRCCAWGATRIPPRHATSSSAWPRLCLERFEQAELPEENRRALYQAQGDLLALLGQG